MLKFTKMHGLGNDYVYMDAINQNIMNRSELAKYVSDRHFGIGSDGLILICKSDIADFKMEMYNQDGSQAEMCGNGIRCVGKFVYDKGMIDKKTITIETLAGIKELKMHEENGRIKTVKVDMGEPVLEPDKIPVKSNENPVKNLILNADNEIFNFTIEFVNIIDEKTLKMRVWERGAGETLACGTGACGVTVASVLNNYTHRKVTVKLIGGDLEIEWNKEDNHVYMTGPAITVFEGEIELNK